MRGDLQYKFSSDSGGKSLKGESYYKMHLPKDIPSCNFWSVIVYDSSTQLMIHTDQLWPSVFSSSGRLVSNKDGSVDICFNPADKSSKGCNNIKTIPGKGWYLVVHLYDMAGTDNNGWKPGEIIEVDKVSE